MITDRGLIHSESSPQSLCQVSDQLKQPGVKRVLMDQSINLILSFERASGEGLIVQELLDMSSYLHCSVAINHIVHIKEPRV